MDIRDEYSSLKLTVYFRCFTGRTMCLFCLHDIDRSSAPVPGALCDQCEQPVNKEACLVSLESYMAYVRTFCAKEVTRKTEARYVPRAMVAVTIDFAPLPLVEAFMERCTKAGSNPKLPAWDQEGPRTLAVRRPNERVWCFTTYGAVVELFRGEAIRLSVPDGQVAIGALHQLPQGSVITPLPPLEVSWKRTEVCPEVYVSKMTIKCSTGNIACQPNTYLHLSAQHPADTSQDSAPLKRWKHLPMYDNYNIYCRYKLKEFILKNKKGLLKPHRGVLVEAVQKPTWELDRDPALVEARVPSPNFEVRPRCWLPNQHPRLTRSACGMDTLSEHLARKEREEKERKDMEDKERMFQSAYEHWERKHYHEGKERTMRCNSTQENRDANYRSFGYSMDNDPRFNGLHEAHGYEGVGPDPCDPKNRRAWLLNASPPPKRHKHR